MTRAELEALQNAIDCIGKGLDSIMDLVCAIEAKGQTKRRKAVSDSISADCRAASPKTKSKSKGK
jgi:hypothetical protein